MDCLVVVDTGLEELRMVEEDMDFEDAVSAQDVEERVGRVVHMLGEGIQVAAEVGMLQELVVDRIHMAVVEGDTEAVGRSRAARLDVALAFGELNINEGKAVLTALWWRMV
jgi:hypothetical protein